MQQTEELVPPQDLKEGDRVLLLAQWWTVDSVEALTADADTYHLVKCHTYRETLEHHYTPGSFATRWRGLQRPGVEFSNRCSECPGRWIFVDDPAKPKPMEQAEFDRQREAGRTAWPTYCPTCKNVGIWLIGQSA